MFLQTPLHSAIIKFTEIVLYMFLLIKETVLIYEYQTIFFKNEIY